MARLHPWIVLAIAALPPACRKETSTGAGPAASASIVVSASASASSSAPEPASASASASAPVLLVASPEALEANLVRARKMILSRDCSPSKPISLRPHLAALVTYTCSDLDASSDEPSTGFVLVGGVPGNMIPFGCSELSFEKTATGGFFTPLRDGKMPALVAHCKWPASSAKSSETVVATIADGHWQRETSKPEDPTAGKTMGPDKTLVFPRETPRIAASVCERAPCSSRAPFRLVSLLETWGGSSYVADLVSLGPVYRALLTSSMDRARRAAAASSASASVSAAASVSAPPAASASASASSSGGSGWKPYSPPPAASDPASAPPAGPPCPTGRLKTPAELLIYSRLLGESMGDALALADALMADFPAGLCTSAADAAGFWPALRKQLLDVELPRLTRERGPEEPLPPPPIVAATEGPLFPDCKTSARPPPAQKSTARACRVKVSKSAKGPVSWQKTSWRRLARATQTSVSLTDADPAIARQICPDCCGAGPWVIAAHSAESSFREHTHWLVDEPADGGLRQRLLSQHSGPGADCNTASDGGPTSPVAGTAWRRLEIGLSQRSPIYVRGDDRGETIVCGGPIDGCGRSCVGQEVNEVHFLEPGTLRSALKISYIGRELVILDSRILDEPKKPSGEPFVWFTADDKGLTVHGEECEGPSVEWPAAP